MSKRLEGEPATPDQINWVRMLLRDEPVISMTTAGRTIPIYSAFTEQPDGQLRFLFRSFEITRHSGIIEEATAMGLGWAAVQLLVYRSTNPKQVGLEMFGFASRVPDEHIERDLDIYNRIRDRREPNDVRELGTTHKLYVVQHWSEIVIQSSLMEGGEHTNDVKAPVTLEQLQGFETQS